MNWSEYKEKKGKTADFKNKEKIIQEAVPETKDKDGKIIYKAIEEKKESYVVISKKMWNSETGEVMPDNEKEYTLAELKSEKKKYDNEIQKAKAQSDGLALAIEDFKKL